LHQALLADGRIFLSSTMLDGGYSLRMAVLNIRTHREHIGRALTVNREVAASAG
jgi:hypothetical protein